MKTEKEYKVGAVVTASHDRSHKIDTTVTLLQKRDDLSQKWTEQDDDLHEVWIAACGATRVLVDRNIGRENPADFTICPDFDNDLGTASRSEGVVVRLQDHLQKNHAYLGPIEHQSILEFVESFQKELDSGMTFEMLIGLFVDSILASGAEVQE